MYLLGQYQMDKINHLLKANLHAFQKQFSLLEIWNLNYLMFVKHNNKNLIKYFVMLLLDILG